MEGVRRRLGIPQGDAAAWHSVSGAVVRKLGGAGLLNRYEGSLWRLLQDVYPELHIEEAAQCRPSRGRHHWARRENRRSFLAAVQDRLGVGPEKAWREVTWKELTSVGGGGLLARYDGSVQAALQETLDEEELQGSEEAHRMRVERGHWDSIENRKAFLDAVKKEFRVRRAEDWALVSNAAVRQMGGSGLLSRYSYSLLNALKDVYGEEEEAWCLYRCRPSVPAGHWEDKENIRAYLLHVREQLGLREKEDWFRVSMEQIRDAATSGASLFHKMPLIDALRVAFPNEDWSSAPATSMKRAVQRHLLLEVCDLLPEVQVVENHRQALQSRASGQALELDIYLPELKLGIEYNGEHHYHEIPFFGPLEAIQRRDREKHERCQEAGIALVTIPYWWDRRRESLVATLWKQCPQVLHQAIRQNEHHASTTAELAES